MGCKGARDGESTGLGASPTQLLQVQAKHLCVATTSTHDLLLLQGPHTPFQQAQTQHHPAHLLMAPGATPYPSSSRLTAVRARDTVSSRSLQNASTSYEAGWQQQQQQQIDAGVGVMHAMELLVWDLLLAGGRCNRCCCFLPLLLRVAINSMIAGCVGDPAPAPAPPPPLQRASPGLDQRYTCPARHLLLPGLTGAPVIGSK
jgi:hypothetical protein